MLERNLKNGGMAACPAVFAHFVIPENSPCLGISEPPADGLPLFCGDSLGEHQQRLKTRHTLMEIPFEVCALILGDKHDARLGTELSRAERDGSLQALRDVRASLLHSTRENEYRIRASHLGVTGNGLGTFGRQTH